jgi:hypothetical protein
VSLADDLNVAVADSEQPSRYGCSVCKALAEMPHDQADSLRKALTSKLGAKQLSQILQKHGIAVGVPSIHLHRREGHNP